MIAVHSFLLLPESRQRRLALGFIIYVVASLVFFGCANRATLVHHTSFNHFALQAEAWLNGSLCLAGDPPAYTGYNDFAQFEGRWYVVFPPFPAVLVLPLVALGGSAYQVQDGQFFIWLAGLAPAVLFLALEKLRRLGRSARSERDNVVLAFLFAFGTVYFFTAEQGTVWFAAHVVGATLASLYLLCAIEAQRPVLAGLVLGLGFLTRAPLVFAAPLFLFEAWRVSRRSEGGGGARVDWASLFRRVVAFSVPVVGALVFALWHNAARFGDPFDFGYQHLTVAWQARMHKWGIFHYHYLARNLGVILTSLPYVPPPGASTEAPFQINGHGLALWVTSPFYWWLLWPRRTTALTGALWVTVLAVALPTLFYQNTGWLQFGYRFSNDYAVFLLALIAVGHRRITPPFYVAALCAVVVNTFGALSFNREAYRAYYFVERSQRVLHQPD